MGTWTTGKRMPSEIVAVAVHFGHENSISAIADLSRRMNVHPAAADARAVIQEKAVDCVGLGNERRDFGKAC